METSARNEAVELIAKCLRYVQEGTDAITTLQTKPGGGGKPLGPNWSNIICHAIPDRDTFHHW
jgi:hypothetical protein